MRVIGILGRKRVGKDTIADYLVTKYKYQKVSIAHPLKEGCRILFDLSWDQVYGNDKDVIDQRYQRTPREILSTIGTGTIRSQFGEDFWIKRAFNCSEYDKIVISDVRFENEIKKIHSAGGLVIKVVCDNAEKEADETHIDKIRSYDVQVENNSTVRDLNHQLDKILGEK